MGERIYLPWVHSFEPALAWIGDPMPDEIDPVCDKLMFGKPAAKKLADVDIELGLSADHGVALADSLPNTWNMYVVSGRLRDALAGTGEPIEFVPVRIRNHKGRLVKQPYFLMNPIGAIDCMDRKQSDFDEDPVDRSQALTLRRLVLDPSKIPEDRSVFRLASKLPLVLVRKDLAYEIYRVQECRGMIFQTLESYGEEFR